MAAKVVRLKLLIDTKGQRVVFGEADKNVIDFLFHLLSLPLGTVCKLLKQKFMVGCLGNLYESVETLNHTYFQTIYNRDTLLNPKVISLCSNSKMLILPNYTDHHPSHLPRLYACNYNKYTNCRNYISEDPNAACPQCNWPMTLEVVYVNPASGSTNPITKEDDDQGGYVKGVVTYMVMDDLTVTPMSTISTITLLNKFNIKNVKSLEERIVILDVNKGVELLEASLQSKTVLTDLFLSE